MNSILSMLGAKNKFENLDSSAFEEQMKADKNAVILDVRTPMEHAEARIPNSVLIDMYNPSFLDKLEALDKSKTYYVYCRSGNRSYHAARQMTQMGFSKIVNLESGIIDWYGEVESDYK